MARVYFAVLFCFASCIYISTACCCCSCECDVKPKVNVNARIGAFNIKTFGPTKGGKPDVMENIRKIVSAYDIILIQEIKDISGLVITDLLDLLNTDSAETFNYTVSERTGRTYSKEQYAFYYKTSKVEILETHQYNDADDVFEREPYSVKINVIEDGESLLMALTGIHVKPSDAFNEIVALGAVYNDTKQHFGIENIVILGDLNADCSYMSKSELDNTALFSGDAPFTSYITNEQDTTTYSTDCAYDRIVVAGADLKSHVLQTGVEHFEDKLGLTEEEMKAVSDHYPVWFEVGTSE